MILLPLETGRKKNRVIKPQKTYYKQGSSFENKAASLYSASIHLDHLAVSIGIAHPKTGAIFSVEHYNLTDGEPLNQWLAFFNTPSISALLQKSDSNTLFSTTPQVALIPAVFYAKDQLAEISDPIIEYDEQEELIAKYIPEIESYIVFPFLKELSNAVKSKIGHTGISHHYASLISAYHLYYVKGNEEMAFVQYHDHHFSLALFKDGKMMLFNSFEMASFEDVVYYTYYSMEQFGFSPEDTQIHLGGFSPFSSEVTTALQRYTKHIYHLSPSNIPDIQSEDQDYLINTIFDIQCG